MANSIGGNAGLNHGISGGQGKETLQRLSQRYSTTFSSEITSAMQLGSSVNYNKNWGEGRGTSESISPNANLNVRNDIFSASLSAMTSSQVPNNSPNSASTAWQTSWASTWNKEFWPTIRINYGESEATNDVNPKTSDSEQKNLAIGTSLDLLLAKINYNYSQSNGINNPDQSENKSANHTASIKANHSFWSGRMAVTFSQQYSESSSEQIHRPTTNKMVEDATQIALTTAGIPQEVLSGELQLEPALSDNDFNTVATTISPDQKMNLGFKFSQKEDVNRIYLYVDPEAEIPLTSTNVAALRFNLYSSTDESGSLWTTVTPDLVPSYDPANSRIILDIPNIQGKYLKIVAVAWPATPDITLTEVQTSYRYAGSINSIISRKQRQISHLTNLAINTKITDKIPIGYTLSLAKNNSGVNESKNLRQAANIKWNLHRYCQPSFSVNESKSNDNDSPTTKSRSYSLQVNSSPIPSVDLAMGTSRFDTFTEGTLLARNKRYSFSLAAAFYPDLNGSFSLSHSIYDYKQLNQYSSSWNASANLTSRLSSKLTTNLSINHTKSKTATPYTASPYSEATNSAINVNIRPSDILSLRVSASTSWADGQENAPISHQISGTLALIRTAKTQLSTGFSYTKKDTADKKSIRASWGWTLSRFFSLRTNGNFTLDEPRLWNINSQLSSRF